MPRRTTTRKPCCHCLLPILVGQQRGRGILNLDRPDQQNAPRIVLGQARLRCDSIRSISGSLCRSLPTRLAEVWQSIAVGMPTAPGLSASSHDVIANVRSRRSVETNQAPERAKSFDKVDPCISKLVAAFVTQDRRACSHRRAPYLRLSPEIGEGRSANMVTNLVGRLRPTRMSVLSVVGMSGAEPRLRLPVPAG